MEFFILFALFKFIKDHSILTEGPPLRKGNRISCLINQERFQLGLSNGSSPALLLKASDERGFTAPIQQRI